MAASIPTYSTLTTVEAFRELVNKNFSKQIREGREYDPRDIQRFNEVDGYTTMFIQHGQYGKTFDENKALGFFHDAMVWRKKYNAYDMSPECFPAEFIQRHGIFYENYDINNCPILYALARKFNKGKDDIEAGRRFIIYLCEKHIRADPGQRIVILADMTETGLKHLDYEVLELLRDGLIHHYPGLVSHILVYKLPLLFEAAWTIVKTWVPTEAKSRLIFVDEKTILQYITRDQISNELGGFWT